MLEILGFVFLFFIALLLIFALWLWVKVKGSMAQHERIAAIEEGMHAPEILLEPNESPLFIQPEAVGMLVQQATDLGATSCGNYDVPAAGARVCAYCLETPPVYIVIYDHDQADPWVDVDLRIDQGRSFSASTVAEIARGTPRHPDDEIVYFAPGTALGVLVRAAIERAEMDVTLAAPPDAFKDYFEAASEKSRKYIETQAVSQDWLNTIAADAGVDLSGDEAEQINFMRADQQVADTEIACFNSLAESGDFTAAQWNEMRDSLVAVWDDIPGEYASGVFYSHIDIPEDLEDDVDALEDGRGPVRARVSELNAKLPEGKRLIFVGKVSSPVEADIYRGETPIV